MKQLLFAALLASTSFIGIYAQTTSNLVVFAQDPKPFYAIVNGIKQNAEPQTNVKITGLTNPSSSIKIVFKDGSPDLNKTIYFESMGREATYRIVDTKKKGYKLRFFGDVAIENAVNNTEQSVVVYHTVETAPTVVVPTEQTVTVTEQVVTTTNSNGSTPTISTTSTPTSTQTENVNVGMNIGGFGVNMNVNVNETGTVGSTTTNTNSNVDYSSTTTTTTTTTTSGYDYGTSDVEVVEVAPVQYVSGYTGNIGCAIPESSVSSIKSSVEDESFSDDKMNVAKQAIRNRCITVSQVRNIMSVFDFEDKKLEFAKYAYERTYDVDNYYLVNKDFDFSSTKDELNKYLQTK